MAREIKHMLDLAGALIGLVLAGPLLVLTAAAILICDGRPVFWMQPRSGLGGRQFRLCKFRTMSEATDNTGRLLDDQHRVTRLGAILRAWSLDELPQLWNVLKGDMSLVGPRPLLPSYLERYTEFQRRRLEVRPGITGWCQITGRNALAWEEKLARDVWYVDHWSLWLDLRILAGTIPTVLRRQGISQAGHATMPEFLGNSHGRS
ncbi:MAG: sugar transferase [Bryobacteraceae bacterium]|jgi:sugar transferase EpsL